MKSPVQGWTDAKFRSWIVSLLRKGTLRFPNRTQCLNEAKTVKKINEASGRLAQHYRCAGCEKEFPMSMVQVNHIDPVVGVEGFISWDVYIERMFCRAENLEVVCKQCHDKITQEEKIKRLELKSTIEQRTNQCYRDMKSRCYTPTSQRYYTHGARGIKVCGRWLESYDNFIEDMGYKPDGHSLERIDNDGDYTPDNCRWATPKEQALNRRTNIYITHDGETLTVSQWAEILGISFSALMKRLNKWPIDKALSPIRYDNQIISEEIKQEILQRYFSGEGSQRALGAEYGITASAISKWVVEVKASGEFYDKTNKVVDKRVAIQTH